jgi:hypothetical protein
MVVTGADVGRGKALFGNLADAELLQGRVHIKADRHVLGHVIGAVGAVALAKGIMRAAVRIAAPGDALGFNPSKARAICVREAGAG